MAARYRRASSRPTTSAMASTPEACLQLYFTALHDCDGDAFDAMFHACGKLLGLDPDGSVVSRDHGAFRAGALTRGASPELRRHDRVLCTRALGDSLCAAKVQIALPAAPTSPTPTTQPVLYTDFVAMLRDGATWKIVAKVYASGALADGGFAGAVAPDAAAAVAEAAWGRYVGSNRRADGAGMARVFHPEARLTFATDDGVRCIPSDDFVDMVQHRWASPDHKPFSHLRKDPRASARDSLRAVDFAGPDVAMVELDVGMPPKLFSDVLFLLRARRPPPGRPGGAPGWWIVAKSSIYAPFLEHLEAEDARPPEASSSSLRARAAKLLARADRPPPPPP